MPERRFRILLVENDDGDAEAIGNALAAGERDAFDVDRAVRLAEAVRLLGEIPFDAVLLDLALPDSHGLATLAAVAASAPDTVVLVLASADTELVALKALHAGAHDYLVKGQLFGTMVARAIRHAIEHEQSHRALRESQERYQRLFETMAQGVALWSADGELVDANPAFERIMGLPMEALRGRTVADPRWRCVDERGADLPAEERPSIAALRCGHEVDGRVMGIENPADGRRRWLLVHARPQLRPGEATPYQAYTTYTDITELREAEAARMESEERLRLITETVHEAFYLADVSPLRMLYMSPALNAIWGIAPEELYDPAAPELSRVERARFLDTIHPADRERVRAEVERRVAGEEVYSEYRIVRADGEERWIADHSYPLHGPRGQVERIVGSAQDITGRKLAAEQLQRSEEHLARVVNTVADGLMIVDLDGRITFANRAAGVVLGLASDEIVGRAFDDPRWRVPSTDGDPVALPMGRVLATGAPVSGAEVALALPDGRRVVLSVNATPLRGPAGELEGVVASIRDVTQAKQAARQMRFQATLLDAVGEAVMATDLQGRITYWNRHAEQRTGWSEAEVLGRVLGEVIASPGTARAVERMVRQAAGGATWAGELAIHRRDGVAYPAFITAAPIRSEAGEVVGVVGASTDLTEFKRLEQQLRQAQRLESVGRLAGGVAHDFNNILTSVQGYATFLVEGLDPADPMHEDAGEILSASDRAAALTRQLLAFSRKQVLQPRVLDLAAVVGGMEKMLRRLIGEDVELAFSAPPGLWRVRADPGQVEQVVLNLAVNARDAMPNGGRLALELENADATPGCPHDDPAAWPRVVLRVSDTGSGIACDVLPHIFDPFYTTKEKGRGTGLGLSTVYGIVAQSGGHLAVRTELGAGTVFEVSLPRADALLDAPEPEPAATAGRGQTLLFVEDEDAVRALGVRVLRRQGYHVLEARGGDDALAIGRSHPGPIDLLVTDVVMPRMSGRELAERLEAARPGLRVLYVSGYTDDIIAHHGVLEEARLFLEKPFSPARLCARVAAALEPATAARA